jgi:hypothetical protein
MCTNQTKGGVNMGVKDIAKRVGCTTSWVYKVAKQLGRLPTVEEMLNKKGKSGRPRKY